MFELASGNGSGDGLPRDYRHLSHAVVIFNPAAGQRDVRRNLARALDHLRAHGWQVTLKETLGRGDATTYAREAVATGCDAVVVAGGDGTINEAVQALAHTTTALGVLPHGTGNVWAREAGIPVHSLLAAARVLTSGLVRTVDLGLAGERYFLMWAGIGFDASVVQDIEEGRPELKRRLGPLAFIIRGAVVALSFMGTRLTYMVNGRRLRKRTIMAVISNARLYAAYLQLAPHARMDDGFLDFYIFKGRGFFSTLRHFLTLLTGRHGQDPEVEYYQVRHLTVHSSKPMPVHTDGNLAGFTPMEFRVVPRALRVIVRHP